ncbi:MAG: hypothetical protein D6752_03925 [Candidatus Nitrosothermus koennekii]|nr:MAG: hypothetical protein D6752_03925 [Candidatus Nitrosothermus koennekii]
MGRSGIEIVGSAKDEIVNMLKQAYADEMLAFHYYWYTSIFMQGLGFVTITNKFKEGAMEELKHAELLADRLNQLGEMTFSNPAEWVKNSHFADVDPSEHLTLKSAVEKAIEIEGKAIKHYNELVKKSKDVDFVTFELATDILADEVKEEQDFEDILTKLEI